MFYSSHNDKYTTLKEYVEEMKDGYKRIVLMKDAKKKRYMCHRLVAETFIEKSKEIHGDAYDYSKVIYGGAKTKVTIICKECGTEFYQTPTNHLKGHGCPLCSKKKQGITQSVRSHGSDETIK